MARSCLGKKRYRTEAFAKKVVAYVRETRGEQLRVYSCSICQGFHLTKKPKLPSAEGRKESE